MRKCLWAFNVLMATGALISLGACQSKKPDHEPKRDRQCGCTGRDDSVSKEAAKAADRQAESTIDILDVQESMDLPSHAAAVEVEEQKDEATAEAFQPSQPCQEESQMASGFTSTEMTSQKNQEESESRALLNLEAVAPVEVIPQYQGGDE